MDKYKFTIKNYHAINNAEIILDGITVIAGINGCGKSTISRWLDAIVNTSNNFERLVAEDFLKRLNREQRGMSRLLQNIYSVDPKIPVLELKPEDTESQRIELQSYFQEFKTNLFYFCKLVKLYLEKASESEIKWIKRYLRNEDREGMGDSFVDEYSEKIEAWAANLLEETEEKQTGRKKADLVRYMKLNGDYQISEVPENLQLEENGLDLIQTATFRSPLGLLRSIYYDSPVALTVRTFDKTSWIKLQECVFNPLQTASEHAKKLVMRIRRIIGGDIVQESDELRKTPELRFKSKDNELDIPVSDVATGIKSFAILLRILENGYIDKNSLLIIDEPEAHLHPQWIVEFARLLVLIHKETGAKILLASHNPDMIAAIQSISLKENVQEATRFYQAVSDSNNHYDFKDLGNGIEGIFESFNIALTRIKEYGV